MKSKMMTLKLEPELHSRFAAACRQRKVGMSMTLRNLIRDYVEESEARQPKPKSITFIGEDDV